MAQKRHTPQQIIRKLREVEVAQGKGKTVPQAVKQIGVTERATAGTGRTAGAPGYFTPPKRLRSRLDAIF